MVFGRRRSPELVPRGRVHAVEKPTGKTIVWTDGVFAGDRELVAGAKLAILARWSTPIIPDGCPVKAQLDTAEGAAAAILLASHLDMHVVVAA